MHEPLNSKICEEYLRTTKAYPKSTTILLLEHWLFQEEPHIVSIIYEIKRDELLSLCEDNILVVRNLHPKKLCVGNELVPLDLESIFWTYGDQKKKFHPAPAIGASTLDGFLTLLSKAPEAILLVIHPSRHQKACSWNTLKTSCPDKLRVHFTWSMDMLQQFSSIKVRLTLRCTEYESRPHDFCNYIPYSTSALWLVPDAEGRHESGRTGS